MGNVWKMKTTIDWYMCEYIKDGVKLDVTAIYSYCVISTCEIFGKAQWNFIEAFKEQ